MESVFSRFESYDFEADERFQDGLKTLPESDRSGEESRLLDMKLFFFNRFVEPIDPTSYKQWRSTSPCVTQVNRERLDPRTPSDSDFDMSSSRTAESSAETELSFAEVMRLVQEGKEVPGVRNLDVRPSNQSPTASQMERILKPWEMSSVSK